MADQVSLAIKQIDEYLQEIKELRRLSHHEGYDLKEKLRGKIRSFINVAFPDSEAKLEVYDESFGKVWIGGLSPEKMEEQEDRHYKGDLTTMENQLAALREELMLQETLGKKESVVPQKGRKHIIYVDGGYRKERGGYIAWFNETTSQTFFDESDCKDSFRCEYAAILHLLGNARGLALGDEIQIRSDNETVVSQLNHEFAINDEDIRKYALKVWSCNERFQRPISYVWIPRAENKAGKILGS